ncbi:divergent polysaccharide deacetylase family protein [Rhodosalinus sp. 5P4]|uniref:divergent polysaccharide deacetylase family protein n=1 Tax=Rhodosalinus sp. 5P4 TaxID=3239196 RepID=UPI0035233FBE
MARGALAGFLWGTALSVVGVAVLSVYSDPPRLVPETEGALDVPAGSGFDRGAGDTPATLPGPEDAPAPDGDAPRADAPAPDDLSTLEGVEREAATPPATGTPAGDIAVPPEPGPAPEAESATDTAPAIAQAGQGPGAPQGETPPAAPQAPGRPETAAPERAALAPPAEPPAEAAPDGGARDAAPDRADAPASAPTRSGGDPAPEAETAGGARPEAAPAPDLAAPATDGEAPRAPEAAPSRPAPPAETSDPVAPDAPASDSDFAAPDGPEAPALPTDEETAAEDGRAGLGRQAGTIGDLAPEVRINRLPGADARETETETAPAPRAPLERFAVPSDAPAGGPLMAIVLLDDGPGPFGPEALAGFPFPLTVAVDPDWEGAEAAMRGYRAQGIEVAVLGALPDSAGPRDAEVAMQAWARAVPEAVAILEAEAGTLQGSRALSEQIGAILADTGHGLVLHSQGLDTGAALAARAGVPTVTIFREIDAEGEDSNAIRRNLDQAAFRARTEGASVMLGRLRAETISALLLWGLQDRERNVTLVPVSKVLMRGQDAE